MNKLVISSLIILGIILPPLTAYTGKNSATITQTHSRDTVNVPVERMLRPSPNPSMQVEIQELDTKDAAVIQFNTEVSEQSVNETIKAIKKANHKGVSAIYLLLDSPGGSVFDGARLITAMENSKVPVYTVCTELCASMAAQILEHGVQRYMVDRSTVMFHPATTFLMQQGEVDKIYSRLGSAKRFIDKFDYYVAKRSGQNYEEFKAKSMREYWDDAEDALADHLIDGIVNIDFVKEVVPAITPNNQIKQDLKQLTLE